MDLRLNVDVVNNLQELKDSLCNLAINNDLDFIGDNGEEYLWKVSKEAGYTSNLDYVVEYLLGNKTYESGLEGLKKYCADFLNNWLGQDAFYERYDFEINEVEGKYVVSITWVLGNA